MSRPLLVSTMVSTNPFYYPALSIGVQPIGNTTFSCSFDYSRSWLRNCCELHIRCRPLSSTLLPRRVLQITGTISSPQIGLLEFEEELGSYLCLSHAWGTDKLLRRTKESLETNKRGIPYRSLSKSFQDAVTVALELDITFLWIDSLNIIQDEEQDWHYEVSSMATIYQNAYLSIVATRSAGSNHGLFSK
jgi:Heterokaryon incompatibility protein (HET)